jgi:hypothetical protein
MQDGVLMTDIITTCPRHGIIKREPTPRSITYVGNYQPGQMRYCPYCGQRTTIEWPNEKSFSEMMKSYEQTKDKFLPPWEE